MAGIDKTYIDNYEDYKRYYDWCLSNNLEFYRKYRVNLTDFFYDLVESNFKEKQLIPICNTPQYMDVYLIRNCPIEFVQNRLKEQYKSDYESIRNHTSIFDTFKLSRVKKEDSKIKVTWESSLKNKKPIGRKYWVVMIEDSEDNYLTYNEDLDKWFDYRELMPFDSNSALVSSFKSLIRKIKNWELPEGTKLTASGRYVGDKLFLTVKKKKK